MNILMRERLKNCRTLPTIPSVGIQVLDLCSQENAKMAQIAGVVRQDPALSARMLRMVNSAWFGLVRQVGTLDRAVTLLGTDAACCVALSFSIMRGLRRNDIDLSGFWRRSLIGAVAARSLARWTGHNEPEVLFLAGLLQDIGILGLVEAFPGTYPKLLASSGGDHTLLATQEEEKLGDDHTVVGAWLVRYWRLPEVFEFSIQGSHDPDRAGVSSDILTGVELVSLSGLLADIWVSGDPVEPLRQATKIAQSRLGVDADNLHTILQEIASALPEIGRLFEINLENEEVLNDILERAKEALVLATVKTVRHARKAQLKAEAVAAQSDVLQEQSKRDDLTGIYNRAYLDQSLSREFEWAKKHDLPLSVVFCDVDEFKKINDNHGHQAGDRVLLWIAQILSNQVRSHDFVGRRGGDEFILILPETPTGEAQAVCERIVRVLSAQPCYLAGGEDEQPLYISLSLGHATQFPVMGFESAEQLLAAADGALYAAKSAGRGCARPYVGNAPASESALATSTDPIHKQE